MSQDFMLEIVEPIDSRFVAARKLSYESFSNAAKSVTIKLPAQFKFVLKHGDHDQMSHGRRGNGGAAWGADRQAAIDSAGRYGPSNGELVDTLRGDPDPDQMDISDYDADQLKTYLESDGYDPQDAVDEYIEATGLPVGWALAQGDEWQAYNDYIENNGLRPELQQHLIDNGFGMNSFVDPARVDDISTELHDAAYDFSHPFVNANGDDDNLSVSLNHYYYESSDKSINLAGSIYDDDGNYAGEWARSVSLESDGRVVAHKDLLRLEDDYRGKGFATAFDENAENYYLSHGIDEVKVHAALDVGGYAWAAAGYDWDKSRYAYDNTKLVKYFPNGIEAMASSRHSLGKLDDATFSAAKGITERMRTLDIDDADFPSPFEISQLGRYGTERVNGNWLGKEILLGSEWLGSKKLNAPTPIVGNDPAWHDVLTAQQDWAESEFARDPASRNIFQDTLPL